MHLALDMLQQFALTALLFMALIQHDLDHTRDHSKKLKKKRV
ncbi:hypothetical protein [Serratia symbiotica]|nr:hypothetical protein [Serratia symbiotica]